MKSLPLFLVLLSFSFILFAQESNERRYRNYVFLPNYNESDDKASVAANLLDGLRDWYEIEYLHPLSFEEGEIIALYRIGVANDRQNEWKDFVDYKKYTLKESRTEQDWSRWDGIVFFDSDGLRKNLIKSKFPELFSSEIHRGQDYYGCIEKKPVFTANLIADMPPFAFVITGTGHPTEPTITDDITLHIYSNKGLRVLEEALFLANYSPSDSGQRHGGANIASANPGKDNYGLSAEDNYGRKRYAKMYSADLDDDNFLDVMFWFRTYKSSAIGEKPGFNFEIQSFTIYKENTTNDGFSRHIISLSEGRSLLEKNKLTWDKGYPQNNDLCENIKHPMMNGIIQFD